MKILLTTLCLALVVSCKKEDNKTQSELPTDSLTSKNASVSSEKIPQNVDEIKKEFAILNDKLLSKKLDSTGYDYSCEEIEGNVHFYYESQQLKMVKHFFADSHFSSVTKYYVKNDKVFFIFKDDTLWQFDGGTPEKPITKDSINQQRIYLQNGNPIQCLEKNFTIRSVGKNTDPETIPNKQGKCDVKELMTAYQTILKNKDKKDKVLCL
ncbi:hypothetical protein SAMN05443633_109128 [Chryseobacterium arachidis]|uniref:Lipoprotein n=1 Tax=Chryseobacterium arachidis TaxID=1416778 RepID=A0A1M5GGM0_9FLAO|nr:hypothetical protein [Chryseobacterium arachidis]SHG02930.1 hypothetical protein SAMN05443633_109128 [Chryseobacterium arachidis]